MCPENIHSQSFSVKRCDRERINGHRSRVIWLTGLSGAGKSTLADALERKLLQFDWHTYVLDGDNIRSGLSCDLGFSDSDRDENIRRVAEVAKLMMDAGLVVITAFISPFKKERELARTLIGGGNFFEVHLSTPLDVCEQRDPKGLYRRARSGEIAQMTGINSPYEAPVNPDFTVDASVGTPDEAAEAIVNALRALG